MAIASTTGATISIAPPNAAADTLSEYEALTWTEIKEVETIGEFGDAATTIEFTALGDARVRKRKGVRNAGDLAVTVANDALDPGQQAAIDAEKTEFVYPVRIVLADAADANDTDSAFYFKALVASARLNIGGANEMIRRAFAFLIDTAILEDPSTVVP